MHWFLLFIEHFRIPLSLKAPNCFNEGEIRLRGGTTSREGRVEICFGGVWGTVCDDGWGTADARVVCRQLGLPTIGAFKSKTILGMPSHPGFTCWISKWMVLFLGARPYLYASFGRGSGPIIMSYVGCNGLETHLANCTYYIRSCSHSEDAGVRCPGMLILWKVIL